MHLKRSATNSTSVFALQLNTRFTYITSYNMSISYDHNVPKLEVSTLCCFYVGKVFNLFTLQNPSLLFAFQLNTRFTHITSYTWISYDHNVPKLEVANLCCFYAWKVFNEFTLPIGSNNAFLTCSHHVWFPPLISLETKLTLLSWWQTAPKCKLSSRAPEAHELRHLLFTSPWAWRGMASHIKMITSYIKAIFRFQISLPFVIHFYSLPWAVKAYSFNK